MLLAQRATSRAPRGWRSCCSRSELLDAHREKSSSPLRGQHDLRMSAQPTCVRAAAPHAAQAWRLLPPQRGEDYFELSAAELFGAPYLEFAAV